LWVSLISFSGKNVPLFESVSNMTYFLQKIQVSVWF
jgi:hypothetical protein